MGQDTPVNNLLADMITFATGMQSALANALVPGTEFRRFIDRIAELQEALAEALAPGTELRAFIESFPAVADRLEKAMRELPPQAQAAFKDARFPPCNQFSLGDVNDIAETYTANGSAAATALTEPKAREAFYDEAQRTRMLDEWAANPKLTNRMRILRTSVAASVDGQFDIAIPALLAQLEGVIVDVFSHTGRMTEKKYKKFVLDLSAKDAFLGVRLDEFVRFTVLAQFEHGKALQSDLSRHAILHGGDTNYGTELNALKVIMLIDYVQALANASSAESVGNMC